MSEVRKSCDADFKKIRELLTRCYGRIPTDAILDIGEGRYYILEKDETILAIYGLLDPEHSRCHGYELDTCAYVPELVSVDTLAEHIQEILPSEPECPVYWWTFNKLALGSVASKLGFQIQLELTESHVSSFEKSCKNCKYNTPDCFCTWSLYVLNEVKDS